MPMNCTVESQVLLNEEYVPYHANSLIAALCVKGKTVSIT